MNRVNRFVFFCVPFLLGSLLAGCATRNVDRPGSSKAAAVEPDRAEDAETVDFFGTGDPILAAVEPPVLFDPPEPDAAGGDWGVVKFAEVRAFRFKGEPVSSMSIIMPGGALNPSRMPLEGVPLNAAQVEQLREAVLTPRPAPKAVAACYVPHHGFLLIGSEGKPVGRLDVCFKCDNHRSWPGGFSLDWDLDSLGTLFTELGIPLDPPS